MDLMSATFGGSGGHGEPSTPATGAFTQIGTEHSFWRWRDLPQRNLTDSRWHLGHREFYVAGYDPYDSGATLISEH